MSRAERVYRALVALALPRRVGRAAREEMVEVFLDLRARASGAGGVARLLFWARMLADLAWTGVVERLPVGEADVETGQAGRKTMGRGREGGKRSPGWGWPGSALRSAVRRPGKTLVAAVTLGLGVGAGTLVAVLVRDVLLEPLPYAEGDELLRLREEDENGRPWWPSRLNFEDWRAAAPAAVTGIEAVSVPAPTPVLLRGRAVRAEVVEASAGLFGLVGARFVRGRRPDEGGWGPGRAATAVVSHDFWLRELAGGPLDGATLLVGTEIFPVVGVLERGFGFLGDGGGWSRPDVWLPLERHPSAGGRTNHGIHVVARRAPGVGTEEADRALDRMAARVADAHGEPTNAQSVRVTSLEDDLLGAGRRPLSFLLVVAVGVLLVVGLNLGGTFLVDGIGRARELQVRRALGAGRRRIMGLLLGEAAVAALPGAAFGFAVAAGGLAGARRLDPGALPRLEAVAVDPGLFALATAAAVTLALASAGLPGLLLSGRAAEARLEVSRRTGAGRAVRRLWNGLIVLQVALTFALLVGTAALARSLASLLRTDLGFQADGVVSTQVVLPESRYPGPEERSAYYERALRELRALPGVVSASLVDVLPHVTQARISGTSDPDTDSEEWMWAGVRRVDPSYFEVLRIPLLRGEHPAPGSPGQALVDRTVDERLYDVGATGARVRSGLMAGAATVTGVVGPVREWGVEAGAIGTVYVDYRGASEPPGEAHLLVRGRDGGTPSPAILRQTLQRLDPQVPLSVEPLETVMARTLGSRRLVLAVTAGFGTLGLILASLGIYGVVAYVARRRLRESGVRLALGAPPSRVRARALFRGVLPTVAGLALGVVLAMILVRVAEGRVTGLESAGASSFALAAAFLAAAAVVASYLPARQVTKVDLTRVLQGE